MTHPGPSRLSRLVGYLPYLRSRPHQCCFATALAASTAPYAARLATGGACAPDVELAATGAPVTLLRRGAVHLLARRPPQRNCTPLRRPHGRRRALAHGARGAPPSTARVCGRVKTEREGGTKLRRRYNPRSLGKSCLALLPGECSAPCAYRSSCLLPARTLCLGEASI